MPYPVLPGRRFEYDIGGGSVYYGNSAQDMTAPLTQAQMTQLNKESNSALAISFEQWYELNRVLWIFLPEKYVVSGLGMIHRMRDDVHNQIKDTYVTVAGSPDSTNGLDGTWINATLPNGDIPKLMMDDDIWRDSIQTCTFSEPIRVLRIKYASIYSVSIAYVLELYALHLYGVKAVGDLPDDVLFLDDDAEGDLEFIRDMDWGDRQEGTTILKRIKLYNSSTTKIASNLSLSLIDTDLLFSMDEGATWVTAATITSLAPRSASASILVKNTIPPPTQLLGPRAPRFEVSIGGWLGEG